MQKVVDTGRLYSLKEYIFLEESGTQRHEFLDGKLIPMPGETLLHNQLCLLIYRLLFQSLPLESFLIFVENVKVKIEGEDKYVYPDVTVIKNQIERERPYKEYIIYEPLFIAEVLSDSTRKHDLTDKFILYQKISSLQYYLAVEPEKHVILFYEKTGEGEWVAKTFTSLDEVIEMPSLGLSLSLKDIYSS